MVQLSRDGRVVIELASTPMMLRSPGPEPHVQAESDDVGHGFVTQGRIRLTKYEAQKLAADLTIEIDRMSKLLEE